MKKSLHKNIDLEKLIIESIDNCLEIMPKYVERHCHCKPQQDDLHIYGEGK